MKFFVVEEPSPDLILIIRNGILYTIQTQSRFDLNHQKMEFFVVSEPSPDLILIIKNEIFYSIDFSPVLILTIKNGIFYSIGTESSFDLNHQKWNFL